MENPNSRPYTPEELEALLGEDAQSSDIPKNNKGGKAAPENVILENNQQAAMAMAASVIQATPFTVNQPSTPSNLKKYAPFIILGLVLTGVGIYLYYNYRRRKAAEKEQKN